LHHEFIIKALDAGLEVYSEKPITVDEEKCRLIRDAEKRSGKNVKVTFNCRFMPYFAKVKELLMADVIGKPLTINYEYTLNKRHGGDYFKRWHRFMENSGGMMVHKATHHFDIVNWLIDDSPLSVCAEGSRLYYGNDDRPHGERCSSCQYKNDCLSYGNLAEDEEMKELYFIPEEVDGYQRDHCVFKNDTDIYDAMSVSVKYEKGAILTYSLNLFSTGEGYTISIVGEKGRLEASNFFGDEENSEIKIAYNNGKTEIIKITKLIKFHGGGDLKMLSMLFGDENIEDTLNQCADSFDGFKSVMIGVGANRSIKEGRRVNLKEILDQLK
jgi:predicted dehydrogenase